MSLIHTLSELLHRGLVFSKALSDHQLHETKVEKPDVLTFRYAACPTCGCYFPVESYFVIEKTHSPLCLEKLFCVACGKGVGGEIRDGKLKLWALEEEVRKTTLLLKILPRKHPIYLTVQGYRTPQEQSLSMEQQFQSDQSLYENPERTISILRHLFEIKVCDEEKPLFEMVRVEEKIPESGDLDRMLQTQKHAGGGQVLN